MHTDYLGSIMALSNTSGAVVEKYAYDAFGNRRNPTNWSQPDTRTELKLDRGYTGHACPPECKCRRKHIDAARLINMNGRMYDPLLGRMLSPDNNVQLPDFTQNLNRYSYCLNNPLIYTDPSGELILGFLRGVYDAVTSGALEFWNWNDDYTHDAWSKADPTLAGTAGNNSYRLWEAYLTTENFWGQLPQNTFGFLTAQGLNTFLDVDYVDNKYGASVVSSKYIDGGAFTMGSFIMGPEGMRADYHDHLFAHEYGHVLQSREMGWFYLPLVAIPSLASYKWDKRNETDLHDT
jgi:RHS repeat-associated protein